MSLALLIFALFFMTAFYRSLALVCCTVVDLNRGSHGISATLLELSVPVGLWIFKLSQGLFTLFRGLDAAVKVDWQYDYDD